MPIRKAVFPAAGLGTRFLPATKSSPKEMLPLVDKPMIQYVIEEAIDSGIEDITIVTGRGKRAIEAIAMTRPDNAQECLLYRIFRLGSIPQSGRSNGVGLVHIPGDQFLERLVIQRSHEPCHKFFIGKP